MPRAWRPGRSGRGAYAQPSGRPFLTHCPHGACRSHLSLDVRHAWHDSSTRVRLAGGGAWYADADGAATLPPPDAGVEVAEEEDPGEGPVVDDIGVGM